mmetsp:Transcript_42612/g.97765  ORF Transcript_42612/g.97765 Transcript_42612/m.97765 type:complete len:637 (-) Transcript_42612:158-2068(-)
MVAVFPASLGAQAAERHRLESGHSRHNLTLPSLAGPSGETRSRSSLSLLAGSASEGLSTYTLGRREQVHDSTGSAGDPRSLGLSATASTPILAIERAGSGHSLDSGGHGADSEIPASGNPVRSSSLSQFRKPRQMHHDASIGTKVKKSMSNLGLVSNPSTRSTTFSGMLSRHTSTHSHSERSAYTDGTFMADTLHVKHREPRESYRCHPHLEPAAVAAPAEALPDDLDEKSEDEASQSSHCGAEAPYEAPTRTTRKGDRQDVLPGGFKLEDDVRTLIKGMETPLLAGYKFGSRGHLVGLARVKPRVGDVEVNELLPEQPEDPSLPSCTGELRYRIALNDGTHRLLSEFQICHPGIFRLVQLQRLPGGFTYGDEVQLLVTSLLTQTKEVSATPALGDHGTIVGPAATEGELEVHFKTDARPWSLRPRFLARAGEEYLAARKNGLAGGFHRKEEVAKVEANTDIGEDLEDCNPDVEPGTQGEVLGPGLHKDELLVLFRGPDRRSVPACLLVKVVHQPHDEERKGSKQSLAMRLLHPVHLPHHTKSKHESHSAEASTEPSSPDRVAEGLHSSTGSRHSRQGLPERRHTSSTGSRGLPERHTSSTASRHSPNPPAARVSRSAKSRVMSPWRLCKALLQHS